MNALTQKKAWHRREDETNKSYPAFQEYLSMGEERSMEKTRIKLGKKSGYNRVLETWSSKYHWVERAAQYDEHRALQLLDQAEKSFDKARSRIIDKIIKLTDELLNIALDEDQYSDEELASMDEVQLRVIEFKESIKARKIGNRIKAIELSMKLAGFVPPEIKPSTDDIRSPSVQNYVMNIYNQVNNARENEDGKEIR